jgi:2,3-bisphosphoglycerate-dependent phosphoglycerate mutase
MCAEVVLVRHAESVPPRAGGPDEMDRPLTAAGVAAAHAIAPVLAALHPAAVLSSPYARAVQTVAPAAELAGLDVGTDWQLREWDSGLPPTPDYAVHYARSWAAPDLARAGGESLRQLTARAVAAVERLTGQHPGGPVVIGSHGTFVARLLAGFGLQIDWSFCHAMPMPAIYRLRLTPTGSLATADGPGLPNHDAVS